ncbi:MAG: hypothetical protein DRP52_01510 [Planctomycetota bacterium]|nr:MAG: hypothetical protein DRP52_01510 [Planctomycetota bacterium]
MTEAILTKKNIAGKKCYYLQFVKKYPKDCCHTDRCVDVADSNTQAWLTIRLGYVLEKDDKFTVSEYSCPRLGGEVLSSTVQQEELEQSPAKFCEALAIAEAQSWTKIYKALIELRQWMETCTGSVPVIKDEEFFILRELRKFKMQLFDRCYSNSSGRKSKCDTGCPQHKREAC